MTTFSTIVAKKQGFIYLISDGTDIKVGFSLNPSQRLRTLKTANKKPLEIVFEIAGTMQREKFLHQRFKKWSMEGEWYPGYLKYQLIDYLETK